MAPQSDIRTRFLDWSSLLSLDARFEFLVLNLYAGDFPEPKIQDLRDERSTPRADRAATRVADHSALVTLQDISHHVASFQGCSSFFSAKHGCVFCAHQRPFAVQNNPEEDKTRAQSKMKWHDADADYDLH